MFDHTLVPDGWNPDKVYRALALDGPMNGQYITPAQANEHGYELCDWTWAGDEKVYMQPTVKEEQQAGLTEGSDDRS